MCEIHYEPLPPHLELISEELHVMRVFLLLRFLLLRLLLLLLLLLLRKLVDPL